MERGRKKLLFNNMTNRIKDSDSGMDTGYTLLYYSALLASLIPVSSRLA